MPSLEAIVRSRRARIALVGSLVFFGGWSFAPYVLAEVSTQAAVNAPVIRLTAAVDGTVSALPPVGRYFERGGAIAMVEPSGDTGDVAQLKAEAELAQATLAMAERQIAEIRAQESKLAGRTETFASATRDRLAADREAAIAAERACRAEVVERQAALARAEKLVQLDFLAPAGLERAQSQAALATSNCDAQRARIRALAATIHAADRGVYLGDGFNDAPYTEQQRDRLLLQRQQLEALAFEARAKRDEARRRLAEAAARTAFKAPAGSYVLARLASPGAAIRAGEPVLDLIDCRRRFIEVAMPERRAEALKLGDPAQVRLIGSDQWLTGRVARVAGAAARKDDAHYAATTSSLPDAREISVEISLPADAEIAPERRCDVGRLAEVRFRRLG